MNIEQAIQSAARSAYDEDAIHIIGRIDGKWAIAHEEDEGRIRQMSAPVFPVDASGVALSATAIMETLDRAGIASDQDWAHETTIWTIGPDTISVSGAAWAINQHA